MQLTPMEALRKLSVDEQDKLVREACSLESKAINATEAHKLSFPAVGKLVCVVEERLNELKSPRDVDGNPRKPLIAVNTSLAAYWGSLTKSKDGKAGRLNPHWYSCAVAFGTYVRTELITEADYDKNTAQCLEIAASISTETGGDVSSDAITEAADVLKDRPKDAAKQLKDILSTLKKPAAMTAEKAKELLASIFSGGHMTTVVIPMLGAEIAHIEDSETARSAFLGMQTAGTMFAQNVDAEQKRRFPDEVIDGWIKAYCDANQPPPQEETKPEGKPETAETKGKGKSKGKATPETQAA